MQKLVKAGNMIDNLRHFTDELAGYKLAQPTLSFLIPTFFAKWIESTREKLGKPSDLQLLQKTFDRMK